MACMGSEWVGRRCGWNAARPHSSLRSPETELTVRLVYTIVQITQAEHVSLVRSQRLVTQGRRCPSAVPREGQRASVWDFRCLPDVLIRQ